ncbi:VgrG protein, partial [Pluralibacter gergoviae]
GGYIKIKGGNVEIGGPGKLLVRNAGIKKTGPASMQGVMKSFEPESFDERFKLTHSLTQEPLANQRYRIKLSDGRLIEGVTSEAGETLLTQSQVTDDMEITWLERIIK